MHMRYTNSKYNLYNFNCMQFVVTGLLYSCSSSIICGMLKNMYKLVIPNVAFSYLVKCFGTMPFGGRNALFNYA